MTQARDLADNKLTGDVEIDGTTLTVDSTNNRVGMGTDSPRSVLDLNTTRDQKIRFGTAGTIGETQNDAGDYIANNLFVSADSGGTKTYTKTTGDNGNCILQDFFNGTTFYTGVTGAQDATGTLNDFERMRIDGSGNVGIGVVPNTNWNVAYDVLQVDRGVSLWGGGSSGASFASMGANYYYDGNYKYLENTYATDFYQYLGGFIWRTAPSGTANNAISFTIAATLNNAGEFRSGYSATGYLSLSNVLTGYGAASYPTLKTDGSAIYFDAQNTYTGYISYNSGFVDISDERDKDNIVTIDNALDKVSQLRGVYHTWKDNRDEGKRHTGLIAQEVNEVMPEVVTEGADKYGVNYGKLVGVLIEAIKELKTENENLRARVEALESN